MSGVGQGKVNSVVDSEFNAQLMSAVLLLHSTDVESHFGLLLTRNRPFA